MRTDHKAHIFAGALIALTVGAFLTPAIGIAAGAVAGIAKEAYDLISGRGTPEWLDILWTFVGAVAGGCFVLGVGLL